MAGSNRERRRRDVNGGKLIRLGARQKPVWYTGRAGTGARFWPAKRPGRQPAGILESQGKKNPQAGVPAGFFYRNTA
jgi:hypothetical protein